MFSLKISKKRNRTYLYLVLSKNGKRHIIHTLGTLEELSRTLEDPVFYFHSLIQSINTSLLPDEKAPVSARRGGELLCLSSLYVRLAIKDLGLYSFFRQEQKQSQAVHPFHEVFCSLVSSQLLLPGSIQSEYQSRASLFQSFDLPESSVYQYLDYFARMDEKIQETLYEHAPPHFRNPENQLAAYDGTNVFFHARKPDEDIKDSLGTIIHHALRKFGFSKENRPLPLVNIGLFSSYHGYPVAWNIFAGNEKESAHIVPELERMKRDYGLEYYTFEADRANSTGKILAYIQRVDLENRKKEYTKDDESDFYIVGKSIRQASKSLKEYALEPGGFENVKVLTPDLHVRQYKMKSRVTSQSIRYSNAQGKTTTTIIPQLQLVYHSLPYARKEDYSRTERALKSAQALEDPSRMHNAFNKGALRYIDFGSLLDKVIPGIDVDKIRAEKELDGYYVILTNLLHEAAGLIYTDYRRLRFNEDDFRILKSLLGLRPVFLRTNEHILAHVTVCMSALVILRHIEWVLDYKYSVDRILQGLRDFPCVKDGKGFRVLYENEIIHDLRIATGVGIDHEYVSWNELKQVFSWRNLSPQLKLF